MKKSLRTHLAVGVTSVALGASMFAPGLIGQAHAVNYARSDYGSNPHAGVNPNAEHGWGSKAWPNCPDDLGTAVSASGDKVVVRTALVPLVTELMNRTEAKGYQIRESGGFNCRPIRGSDKPSNHSRARAIDINPKQNPMSYTFRSDIPPEVVSMWEGAGFYWGGRYKMRVDTMHFEYVGTPQSVEANLAKLRGSAAPAPGGDPCTNSTALVKKGDRGEAVSDAQCLLARKGFAKVKTDGIFGRETHKATVAFQRANGLAADGKIGSETWAKLKDQA